MRCPKCGFNSFDHNLTCPKCRADLTAARRLLNLTVPSPGLVDFFNPSDAAFPDPLPEAEVELELVPEAADLTDLDFRPAPEATEPGAGTDDEIEPADGIDDDEDIEPTDAMPEDDDIAPLDAAEDQAAGEIYPEGGDEGAEDISPLDDGQGAGAAPPEQPPADDEDIQIEVDEVDVPGPDKVQNKAVRTALAQIKTTLTATGDLDLNAAGSEPDEFDLPDTPVELEAEPEIVEIEVEPIQAEQPESAAAPAADTPLTWIQSLVAEAQHTEEQPPGSPSPSQTQDTDFDDLTNLADNLNLDDLDEKK